MSERIAQIEQQAQAAIAAATTTGALEEVRIRYLGRKAELPNLLRGVGAAARPSSAPRPGRRQTRPARRSTRRSTPSARRSPPASSSRRLKDDRVDVTLPGRPGARDRSPAPDHADAARDRGRLHRARVRRRRGPRGRDRLLQLRRAQPRPDAPGALADRHLLRRAHRRHLRPAGAAASGPHRRRSRSGRCSSSHRRSTSSSRVASTAATTTPPTRPSSTRSRAWRSTTT